MATLLHEAGVKYAILGEGETCTGDPARRIGNEFLFEMLAKDNIANLTKHKVRKVVTPAVSSASTICRYWPCTRWWS